MTAAAHSMSARFLGEPGKRFMAVHFNPAGKPLAHIIYLPPFGEEMNRCRALAAEQARQFACVGYSCTVMDFYGTGDSEGELHEADFAIWLANIQLLIDTLQSEYRLPVVLWGLRLGAVLALEYAAQAQHPIQDILLWQPVTSCKRYVTQILRQRVASLVGKDLPPETTEEIRQRLEEGQNVEISGYLVGRGLIRDMERADPYAAGRLCSGKIHWLENVSEPGELISTGSGKAVARLQENNGVEVQLFADPPLWQLHKRDTAPELLSVTQTLFSGAPL
jgi:exosortase A-associated hydrolase 2